MKDVGNSMARGLVVFALLAAASGAAAASLDDLVPGEWVSDAETELYYGRGIEGIEAGSIVGNPTTINVDEFLANISPSAGAEQGFVNVFQISGDDASVTVIIQIDVNINGVEIGGPIAGNTGDIGSGVGGAFQLADNTITVTATADVGEGAFDLITNGGL